MGGSRFETTLTTLRRFPGSMLATMFLGSDRIGVPLDADGFVFIDRNHEFFGAVLDYFRTGEVVWPTDSSRRRALLREFEFYALEPPPELPADPPKCCVDPVELRRMLSVNTALELSVTDFAGFDFSHLVLCGSRFAHAILAGAQFVGADLSNATLRHADLRGANLCGANLSEADLSYADLRGVRLDIVTDMEYCKLDGANLSGLDLRAFKNFATCSIDDANFSNCDLRGVAIQAFCYRWEGHDRGYEHARDAISQDYRELRGCVFDGADLTGSEFPNLLASYGL